MVKKDAQKAKTIDINTEPNQIYVYFTWKRAGYT